MKVSEKKNEVIKRLKDRILTMEGFGGRVNGLQLDFGLGAMQEAFPRKTFPVGVMHEFICSTESRAATGGVLAHLLSVLMREGKACLWISPDRKLFSPGLKFFGVEPHQVIFIDVKKEKEVLWAMEQGLKCNAIAAVVAELQTISFSESRRLQLAVENSGVTGFILRYTPFAENNLACASRWRIKPLPSQCSQNMPGVGFPRVEINLEKIRNGRPGIWEFEWQNGELISLPLTTKELVDHRLAQSERSYA